MALKHKITKAEFDKLSKDLQEEYKADGEEYTLDVIGLEDTGALRRSKDRETQARKDAEDRVKQLETELSTIDADTRRKVKDIDALDKQWQADNKKIKDESDAKISKLESHARSTMISSAAMAIASKISTVPALMSKAIAERMVVDFADGVPTLKILGADGKVSDMTTEKLEAEFVGNKEYASIITGSKASGGGAGKDPSKFNNGNGGAGGQSDKPVMLHQQSHKDLAAHLTAIKESKQG